MCFARSLSRVFMAARRHSVLASDRGWPMGFRAVEPHCRIADDADDSDDI